MYSNIDIDKEEYLCPLTLDYMIDPVLASDGKIYEHIAIKKWYDNNRTSPFTREILDGNFILQEELKSEIGNYMKENNIIKDDFSDNLYNSEQNYIKKIKCPFCNNYLIIKENHINRYSQCPYCQNRLCITNYSRSIENFILSNNNNLFNCQIM